MIMLSIQNMHYPCVQCKKSQQTDFITHLTCLWLSPGLNWGWSGESGAQYELCLMVEGEGTMGKWGLGSRLSTVAF